MAPLTPLSWDFDSPFKMFLLSPWFISVVEESHRFGLFVRYGYLRDDTRTVSLGPKNDSHRVDGWEYSHHDKCEVSTSFVPSFSSLCNRFEKKGCTNTTSILSLGPEKLGFRVRQMVRWTEVLGTSKS